MSVVIDDPNEIQSYIETLIRDEQNKLKKLEANKKTNQIKEVNNKKQIQEKPVSFMEIIHLTSSLLPGKKIFFKFVDASLPQLQQRMKTIFKAPDNVQFSFALPDKKIAIRDDADIYLFGYYYFSHKLPSIDVEIIDAIPNYKLKQQKQSKSFVYCKYGSNNYYIIVTLDNIKTYDDCLKHFKSIFGEVSTISYIDSENDKVSIDSEDSFQYLIEDSNKYSTKGYLLELIIN